MGLKINTEVVVMRSWGFAPVNSAFLTTLECSKEGYWLFWGGYRYICHSWTNFQIFKSCFLLHYQKYVFCALPLFQKL